MWPGARHPRPRLCGADPPPAPCARLVVSRNGRTCGPSTWQNFVYFTLTQFNPLVLTTVTTTRKIFSTLYSVFRSPSNRLSTMQWAGCSMVFSGLLGDIARKATAKKRLKPPEPEPTSSDGDAGVNGGEGGAGGLPSGGPPSDGAEVTDGAEEKDPATATA